MSPVRVVLFDGLCGLCDGAVRFMLRQDRAARFRFAPLQSEAARARLAELSAAEPLPDSIVLIEDGAVFTRSDAVLRIGRGLGAPWSLLAGIGACVPRLLRDALYDAIARSRKRWFGAREQCRVPTAEERARFL